MVREPFVTMSPATFATLTDAQIWGIYFRARDDDGRLIRRKGKTRGEIPLPSAEGLAIPPEVWEEVLTLVRPERKSTPPMDWILTFWMVELQRGKSVEEVLALYKESLERGD